jgi:hypothetical protein
MIPRERSIVRVDHRHYRKIAQENWGLTDEQMRGKHVHHRIRRADGGTNDPSNLYVCSEWFHDNVWHAGEGGFTGLASEAGKLGAKAQPRDVRVENGRKVGSKNLRDAIERNPDHQRQAGVAAGKVIRDKIKNDPEFRQKCVDNGRKTCEIIEEKRKNAEYDEHYRSTRSAGGRESMLKHNKRIVEKSCEKSRKAVILTNLDTGEERIFISLSEAAKCLGLSQGLVSAVLHGSRSHTGRWAVRLAG